MGPIGHASASPAPIHSSAVGGLRAQPAAGRGERESSPQETSALRKKQMLRLEPGWESKTSLGDGRVTAPASGHLEGEQGHRACGGLG